MNNMNEINNLREIYACPMHEEVQQNKPGTCSKCGMVLIAIKKDTKAGKSHFGFSFDLYKKYREAKNAN